MVRIDFTKEEIEQLNYERYHYPHPKVQKRMEALYLKALNYPHHEIAKIVGVTPTTARGFFKCYQENGIEGLKNLNYHRPPSELVKHLDTLEIEFKERPPATINEAAQRIEQITGIKRCPTQVREFLKKNGFEMAKSGTNSG